MVLAGTTELAPLLNGGDVEIHMSGEVLSGILLAAVRAGVKALVIALIAKVKTLKQ